MIAAISGSISFKELCMIWGGGQLGSSLVYMMGKTYVLVGLGKSVGTHVAHD